MSKTSLLLLGTGTPNCDPARAQTCSAVIVDDFPYFVDCGGGTIQRISQAEGIGHESMRSEKITHMFLTHLHPDHVVGLADFMIAPWVRERVNPIYIHGPKGTKAMVEHLLAAFTLGIGEHANGLAPVEASIGVNVVEYDEGIFYEDDKVSVEAFRVSHGGLDAYGFKFITPDKTIVFSGDTGPVDIMYDKAMGCDILVHEVYCKKALDQRDPGWKAYHLMAHTSTIKVADIANKTKPNLVVLHHSMTWGLATDEEMMEEITSRYDGTVHLGRDLDYFE